MSDIKIFHFSDIHIGGGAEDFWACFDKRAVGIFNFKFRRQFIHDMSFLKRFTNFVELEKPDLLICTGDLTSTAQIGEFEKVSTLFAPLLELKIPLIYLPGNHDYYTRTSKCVRKMKETFLAFNHFFNLSFEDLPKAIDFKGITLLLLNEVCPTNLFLSCGFIDKKTDLFLKNHLNSKQQFQIMIGHYPIIEDHPFLRLRHRLWGQKSAIEFLKSNRINLSLNGHIHQPYTRYESDRPLECCSGSLTKSGHFASITIEPKTQACTISHYQITHTNIKQIQVEQRHLPDFLKK